MFHRLYFISFGLKVYAKCLYFKEKLSIGEITLRSKFTRNNLKQTNRSKSNQNEKKTHKFEKTLIEDKLNSVQSKRCRS